MHGAVHPFPQYAFVAWRSVKSAQALILKLASRFIVTTYKFNFTHAL